MKKRLIVSILSACMFIFIGVLLPMHVSAVDSGEKAYALAQEDCKKIAGQLGEKTPTNLYIGGTGLDTYSVGCGFTSEGSLGYASQQIEDIQITIDVVGVARRTPEAARTLQAKKASLKDTTEVFKDGFVKINRETPDGSEYIYKGYLLFGWPELRKTHTAKVSIDRGTCGVSVTARSRYKDKSPGGHHTSNPETGGDINNHPGFNHDREAEMLALAREKGIELLNVLDCGNDISSPSSTIPAVATEVPFAENQVSQNPYTDCTWNCAEQTEAKYQCSFKFPLDSCVTDKMSYQSTCQNTCWDQWRLPSKPNLVKRGTQINKVEQDGKTALLVVGYDSSKPSDSAMEQMKNDLASWDPDAVRLNVPTSASNIPLGIGVLSLDGNDIDIKRPGSKAWEPLRKGTSIPEGSKIFTGIDSNVWIYGKFGVANIAHGSYITIERDSANQGNDPNIRFDIKFGEVEIRYEKANYQGIIQTRTPSATATVRGTKFITSYNQEQRYSAIGVYEGQVEVQSLITGEKVMLSSDMGSNLVFIPLQKPQEKNKKTPVVAKQESQEQKSNNGIITSVVILGVGGLIFFLYRTGKLLPLYKTSSQKISELMGKNSKGEERK